jgi:hypothetical protein
VAILAVDAEERPIAFLANDVFITKLAPVYQGTIEAIFAEINHAAIHAILITVAVSYEIAILKIADHIRILGILKRIIQTEQSGNRRAIQ